MEIEKTIYDKLVTITRKASPNEACAYLFSNDSVVVEATPHRRSVVSFDDIDEDWVLSLIEKYGTPSSLFHSHPGVAMPSYKDFNHMIPTIAIWRTPWLIMSNTLKLRAWTLEKLNGDYKVKELTMEIKHE